MLINDLDKLMEEMGEKQQRNRHIDPSIHRTVGILVPLEEECNTSIEPCTGLLEEYSANRDSYTAEEKEAINKAIGRYNGLLIKQGFSDVEKYIKELGEDIPNLLDGFFGAFEGTE